ncbi:MAG: hypothetical protein FWG45_05695 [Oscillospiraceae bacterium]|nr:hypothetical protein [Oscillospiraceae bacterium]
MDFSELKNYFYRFFTGRERPVKSVHDIPWELRHAMSDDVRVIEAMYGDAADAQIRTANIPRCPDCNSVTVYDEIENKHNCPYCHKEVYI